VILSVPSTLDNTHLAADLRKIPAHT
jgi:hypothetical protein